MTRRLKVALVTVALAAVSASATVIAQALNQHPQLKTGAQEIERTVLHATGRCGVERWPVKTLADTEASQVDLTPVRATVAGLVLLPRPPITGFQPPRSAPVEFRTYRIGGTRLIGYKMEADQDIHLILRSTLGTHPTMIAEIPNPACAQTSVALTQITAARASFVAQVGSPSSSFQSLDVPVTLSGAGFYDFLHGQTGVAPNGIELHPVLSFRRLP